LREIGRSSFIANMESVGHNNEINRNLIFVRKFLPPLCIIYFSILTKIITTLFTVDLETTIEELR
jgi:hypothetical protein